MANTKYLLGDVEALYPHLNQTYRFDGSQGDKGLTVPCSATEANAKFSCNFKMSKAKAVDLYKKMKAEYANDRAEGWKEMPAETEVFKVGEDGLYEVTTQLKGMFGKDVTKPPRQYDAKNALLPEDFELTTGSTVNTQVEFVSYNSPTGNGVSLRLRAIQVLKLAERKVASAPSPFGEEDGFDVATTGDGFADGFSDTTAAAPVAAAPADDFDAPAPAPKAATPKAATPKASVAKKPTATVEDFNDIDEALDSLDFE